MRWGFRFSFSDFSDFLLNYHHHLIFFYQNGSIINDTSKMSPVKPGSVSATKEKLAATIGRMPMGPSSTSTAGDAVCDKVG